MPAPPVVHALISLNEPEPRCGAAGLFLAAAIHREYVTCADCLKASNDVDVSFLATTRPLEATQTPTPFRMDSPERDRGKLAASRVSEKAFRQEVVTAAKAAGWMCYFTWTSVHSPAGFPDLVLVKPPLMLLVELKTEKGKVTKSQRQWLEALAQVTEVVSAVWRPRDLAQIQGLLRSASSMSSG